MAYKYPLLVDSILRAPALWEKYDFYLLDVGERGIKLDPGLIQEVRSGLVESIRENFSSIDGLVTLEPGGNHWGMLVAADLDIPLYLIRCRQEPKRFRPGVFPMPRKTGYNSNFLFFDSDLAYAGNIIVLDDVISTCGTLDVVLNVYARLGVKVQGVQAIYAKPQSPYRDLEQKFDVPIKVLVDASKRFRLAA